MNHLESNIDKVFSDKPSLEISEFYAKLYIEEARKTKIINLSNAFLKVAASVVFLFLFARAYHIDHIKYPDLESYEIVAIHFYMEELSVNYRGDSQEYMRSFAFNKLIRDHKYKDAANLCQQLYNQTASDLWLLKNGQCLMQTGDYDSAETYLRKIAQSGSPFSESAKYNQLGCYLALKDEIKAKAIISDFKKNNQSYYLPQVTRLEKEFNLCSK